MAVKKQERRIKKYLDIDRSIETIGLRTRSGLRVGLPYSNKWDNGRRSISEQGDYLVIFFFSFSTLMFIIATFTDDRDDIEVL